MLDRARLSVAAVLVALGTLIAASPASAAPGELDPSFGSGGVLKIFPSKETVAGRAVAVQPDGKIVIAGGEEPGNIWVARLLTNGALDPSFGAGGKVSTAFPGGFGEAQAVLIQPDGKIVVAGEAKGAVNGDFVFVRYDSSGVPDPSFGGGDGIVIVPVGSLEERAEALALGPGGRIVATGYANLTESPNPRTTAVGIVVLLSDGTPDPSFAGDGTHLVTTSKSGELDQGEGVVVLGDGRILIADAAAAGAGKGFVLVRLLPTSAPDPSFGGGDGVVETPIPIPGSMSAPGRVTDVALLPDGRIAASGYAFEEPGNPPTLNSKFAAVRYLPDGELDPSFGAGGIFSMPVGSGGAAQAIELGAGGRAILAGRYDAAPSDNSIAALRLSPNGVLDPSFGTGGVVARGVTAPFGENFEGAAIDLEERLLTVSRAYIGGGNTEVVVTRYLGDPRPPAAANRAPRTRMKKVPRKIAADRLENFLGTASDPDGDSLSKVQIAVTKLVPGGAKASARGKAKCLVMKNAKARFKQAKPKGKGKAKRCPQRWLTAKGKAKWSFKLKKSLAPGRYVVYSRAIDAGAAAESAFSRKAGNRYAFRILPSR